MTTIKLPVQRYWNVHKNRESLYVELDLEQLRKFISQVAKEAVVEMEHDK